MPTNPQQTWTPAQLEAMKLYGITPPPQQQPQPGQPPPAPYGIPAPGSKEWLDIIAKASGGETKAPPAQAPQAKQAAEVIPEPEKPDYKKGSTMWELGFRTQAEYNMAQQKGTNYGPHSGKLVADDTVLAKVSVYNPEKKQQSEEWVRVRAGSQPELERMAASGFTNEEWYKLNLDITKDYNAGRISAEEGIARLNESIDKRLEAGQSVKYFVPVLDKLLTKKQADALGKLEGEAQFEYAKDLGLYPDDSKLVYIGDEAYIVNETAYEAYGARLRSTAAATKKAKRELKEWEEGLRKSDPYLYQVYKGGGVEAYNAAVAKREADINGIMVRFAEKNTQLPDGQWMSNEFLAELKTNQPYAYELLTTKGFTAYESEYSKTKEWLEKNFKDKDGNIMLATAMLSAPNEKEARRLEILYDKDTIGKIYDEVSPVREDALKLLKHAEGAFEKSDKSYWERWKERMGLQGAEFRVLIKGFPLIAPMVEKDIQKARDALHKGLQSVPGIVGKPIEFVARTAAGALVMAPFYTGAMALTIAGVPMAKDKPAYIREIGKGIFEYFKDVPKSVAKDPSMAGELIGTFILGPRGFAKLTKTTVAKLSPYHISGQGMRFSFSTGKLSVTYGKVADLVRSGRTTAVYVSQAITKAINRLIKHPGEAARVRIGKTDVELIIEATPVSKRMGGALYHATPDITPYLGESFTVKGGGAEPALFASVHAAARFAITSAKGKLATKPGLLMIYTRDGLKWYPHAISEARSLAEMKAKGFEYLGSGKAEPGAYGPLKTYGKYGNFENEAMFAPGTKLYRVKNLHSRILGERAGEFVTTEDGWVLPILRFAERGAKVPKVSLADLAAIRVNSVIHSLRLITKSQAAKGRAGFRAEYGYAEIGSLARQFEAAGRVAMRAVGASAKEGARFRAYNDAIDRAMRKHLRSALREYPTASRFYRKEPAAFERAYLDRLNRNFAEYYRVTPATRAERFPGERAPGIPRGETLRTPEPPRPPGGGQPPRVEPPRPPRGQPPPRVPEPPRPPRVEPPPAPPKPPPPRKGTDADKRRAIIEAGGMAVTYRRGKLSDSVWHTWYRPGGRGEWQREIIIGEPPRGARMAKGAKSAYRTIQSLGGKMKGRQVIMEDTGAVDTRIELGGKQPKISFERDVRLTPRFKRLTPRPPRITPKTPRITPKTPRIR